MKLIIQNNGDKKFNRLCQMPLFFFYYLSYVIALHEKFHFTNIISEN